MTKSQPPQTLRSTFRARLPFEVASSLVICALLYYAVQKVDLHLLWGHITQDVDRRIFLALFFSWLIFMANGLRLQILVKSNFYTSYQIVNFGSLLNVALPFRLGDVARIYLSRRYYGISGRVLLVAAVVEKFLDLSVVLALAALALLSGALNIIPLTVIFTLAGLIAAAGTAYLIFRKSKLVDRIIERLPQSFGEQVRVLLNSLTFTNLPRLVLVTVCIWIVNIACTFATFYVMLPSLNFGFLDAVALTVITALAVAVPGAPAGMGIFEAGVVAYLTQVHNVDGELALASGLIFHAVLVAPPLAGVFVGLSKRFTS